MHGIILLSNIFSYIIIKNTLKVNHRNGGGQLNVQINYIQIYLIQKLVYV